MKVNESNENAMAQQNAQCEIEQNHNNVETHVVHTTSFLWRKREREKNGD